MSSTKTSNSSVSVSSIFLTFFSMTSSLTGKETTRPRFLLSASNVSSSAAALTSAGFTATPRPLPSEAILLSTSAAVLLFAILSLLPMNLDTHPTPVITRAYFRYNALYQVIDGEAATRLGEDDLLHFF